MHWRSLGMWNSTGEFEMRVNDNIHVIVAWRGFVNGPKRSMATISSGPAAAKRWTYLHASNGIHLERMSYSTSLSGVICLSYGTRRRRCVIASYIRRFVGFPANVGYCEGHDMKCVMQLRRTSAVLRPILLVAPGFSYIRTWIASREIRQSMQRPGVPYLKPVL